MLFSHVKINSTGLATFWYSFASPILSVLSVCYKKRLYKLSEKSNCDVRRLRESGRCGRPTLVLKYVVSRYLPCHVVLGVEL